MKYFLLKNFRTTVYLFDILCWNKILPIRGSIVSEISILLYGSMVHLGFRMMSLPSQSGTFFDMDSEVLNQIQSEIRENKETVIIAGVNKQN